MDYTRFTQIPKGKLAFKFITLDIKLHRTENPQHDIRSLIGFITLKGVEKDILHIIFPYAFDKQLISDKQSIFASS